MLPFQVDPKSDWPKVLASLCDYLFIKQKTLEDEIVGALTVGADPKIRTPEEAGHPGEIWLADEGGSGPRIRSWVGNDWHVNRYFWFGAPQPN